MIKRAVLTGVTGCVGRNILDELISAGDWHITVLHRKESNLDKLKNISYPYINYRCMVDPYDFVSVYETIPTNLDAVFHAAGNTSYFGNHEIQYKDNVVLTNHLCKSAVIKQAKKFVFTSTAATYGDGLIDYNYVRTKKMAEKYVEHYGRQGLQYVIMKPAIVFGKYDYNNYSKIFQQIKNGQITKGLPGNIEFCHAKSVAKAHISAVELGKNGESYYLGGEYCSWKNVFNEIAKICNRPPITKAYSKTGLKLLSYLELWKSKITRTPPRITPKLVDLLSSGRKMPSDEFWKSSSHLNYESLSITEMVSDCHNWMIQENMYGTNH